MRAALLFLFLPCAAHALDVRLASVNDVLYVLQHDAVTPAQIAASDFDMVVMDNTSDGSAAGEFSSAEISAIRDSGKVVLCYLSIGEAEDYRPYWNSDWAANPPAWLGPEDPDWPGNHKVRYWDPDWQQIITSSLDRIVDQGYDGMYLDIIDGYEFWSTEQPERTRTQARADMANFVAALRQHARQTRGATSFLVFPQNAPDIIYGDDFETVDATGIQWLSLCDGIGMEDVFYDETTAQAPSEVEYVTTALGFYREANRRLVMVTDYVWNASNPSAAANVARYNDFETQCLTRGYVPYAAVRDRDLNEILSIPTGGGILAPQPKPDSDTPTGVGYTN